MELKDIYNVERSFKYFNYAVFQLFLFYGMFDFNLEIISTFISILVFTIMSGFLVVDVIKSPKNNDIVAMYIFIAIVLTFVANCLLFITLTKIHYKFSAKGSPILFTKNTRKDFDAYKILFVLEVILIGIVSIMFFMLPKVNDKFVPFFNTNFSKDNFLSEFLFTFGIKPIVVIPMLVFACVLVFIGNKLSLVKANQLYIPDEPDPDPTKKQKTAKSWFSNMFNGISLNYIMNYTYNMGL